MCKPLLSCDSEFAVKRYCYEGKIVSVVLRTYEAGKVILRIFSFETCGRVHATAIN